MTIYLENGTPFLEVVVDDESYRFREMMTTDQVVIKFSLTQHKEIPVGSYIDLDPWGRYEMVSPSDVTIRHRREFEYTITFVGTIATLAKYRIHNMVDGRLKFDYVVTARQHLEQIVANLNEREGSNAWSIGVCIDSKEKLISYNHTTCQDALSSIAETFNTEFEVKDKTISLKKVEYYKDSPLELAYGKGKGLVSGVARTNHKDSLQITKVFVQGGDRNIDLSTYGSHTLHLPTSLDFNFDGTHIEGEEGYDANGEVVRMVTSSDGLSVRLYDAPTNGNEDSLDLTDIYPSRTGKVSSVLLWNSKTRAYVNAESVTDWDVIEYDIVDSSIPSTLNYSDCLMKGETMTIVFQSGQLAGREFGVKYRHEEVSGRPSRRFELVKDTIDGVDMPSRLFLPRVDDEYIVYGMDMPSDYVTTAEKDMLRDAAKYLYENRSAKQTFKCELDGIWAKRNWESVGSQIVVGGYVRLKDESVLPVEDYPNGYLIRIFSIKEYINTPHSPIIELCDDPLSSIGGLRSSIHKLENDEAHVDALNDDTKAFVRRTFRSAQETSEMLERAFAESWGSSNNPISLQTMQLLAGDESLQFKFWENSNCTGAITKPVNVGNDAIGVVGSYIQHLTLDVKDANILTTQRPYTDYRVWHLNAKTFEESTLDPSLAYYVYAKVNKVGNGGEYIISDTPIEMRGDENYYHLLVGILNSRMDGARSFAPTFGYTEILPSQVTTDVIRSTDGNTKFDLATGIINLNNLSGMSGALNAAKGNKSIASWWGGKMVDGERLQSGENASDAASALIRFDGTGYFAKGLFSWDSDGSGKVAGGNLSWDKDGNITLSKNVTIGGTASDTLDTILTQLAQLTNWFHMDSNGNVYTTYNFYSQKQVSAFGYGTSGSSSDTAIGGLLDSWDKGYTDTDALAASLGVDLKTRLDRIEGGGLDFLQKSDILDSNSKILTSKLPDFLLGQVLYGGTVGANAVATLSTNAKSKLGTTSATITLTNNTTAKTGYKDNEGIYYIASSDLTFAGLDINVGDWLISTGGSWQKIDNTDAVTSVNNKIGAVTITKSDIGLGNVENIALASWVKEANKPTYTLDEVADGTTRKLSNYLPLSGGTLTGSVTASSFIKSGGTSRQFLKADGSIDSTKYAGSQSAGGPADYVRWEAASSDVPRRIPFAWGDNVETTNARIRMVYSENFKYNPASNILTVGGVKIGDAIISWDSAKGALKIDKAVYSTGQVSAFGEGGTTSGSTSGGVSRADTWAQAESDSDLAIGATLGLELRSNLDSLTSRVNGLSGDYLPLTGGTLSGDVAFTDSKTITLTKFANRKLILSGNDITFDMSKATGGWAGAILGCIDPTNTHYTALGFYGGSTGLSYFYIGGTYNDPNAKLFPDSIEILKSRSIIPLTTTTYDLGSSSKLWNGVYAANFYENGTALSSKYLQINSGTYTKKVTIGGQSTSYRKTLIALCEVSTTNNTSYDSYSGGTIYFHRSNGLSGAMYLRYTAENQYANGYVFNFNYDSNIKLNVNMIPSHDHNQTGFRPCVFKYNDKWYGGILYDSSAAETSRIELLGTPATFTPFGFDVYHYQSGKQQILNEEAYNSIRYDAVNYDRATLYANHFAIPTGLSSQFLKADGSLDSNVYLKASELTASSIVSALGDTPVNNASLAELAKGLSATTSFSSENENAAGWYKIATIQQNTWGYSQWTFLISNSYSGILYNSLVEIRCSSNDASLSNFAFNIMAGTDIRDRLGYVATKDGSNTKTIDIYLLKSRYGHPVIYTVDSYLSTAARLTITTGSIGTSGKSSIATESMTGFANYDLQVGNLVSTGNFTSKGYYLSDCQSTPTTALKFGWYQWGNEVQFTYRDANNVYKGESFSISVENGRFKMSSDIVPSVTNTRLIGNATNMFKGIYATDFYENGVALSSKYLPKLTYEWNKEVSFGSSGVLCIGKFCMYDSNITVDIDSTTNITYHGTLVIATQNMGTASGGVMAISVYGDASNTLANNIFVYKHPNGDALVEVYFKPSPWSKNAIRIRAVGLANVGSVTYQTYASDICTNVTSVPTNATLKPTNKLYEYFLPLTGGEIDGTLSIKGTNVLKIGEATLVWDATKGALKIDKAVYSTDQVSAFGSGGTTSGTSGEGVSRADTWEEAEADHDLALGALLGLGLKSDLEALTSRVNGLGGDYLPLSGGTIKGFVALNTMNSNNVSNSDASNALAIVTGDLDRYIAFSYTSAVTAGASWRLGMQGSGQGDANYFVLQSGTNSTTSTTWNNVVRFGQNTYDATFFGKIIKNGGTSTQFLKADGSVDSNTYVTTSNEALTNARNTTWTSKTDSNAYPIAFSPNVTPANSGMGYNSDFSYNPSTKSFKNNGCVQQYDATNKCLKFVFV